MKTIAAGPVTLYDFEPTDDLEEQVLAGLRASPKRIPSKFFYDEEGAGLFEAITELPEYYPTRAELAIMEHDVAEMAACIGPGCRLVEFGSGSSLKTRILLDALEDPVAYVPIDISREHLLETAQSMSEDYPQLVVQPVCADYTQAYELPPAVRPANSTVAYFPGSTIGNFTWEEAVDFLGRVAGILGAGSGLLLGTDLHKDKAVLDAAYNDGQGLTAAFNLNLLTRINRELNGDFDLEAFAHVAFYAESERRIEMHLESLCDQSASVAGNEFSFATGERILTEYSYKYTPSTLKRVAEAAGFGVDKTWTDADNLFSVEFLRLR
jgi:dimethylhistidine N-methyltransferase